MSRKKLETPRVVTSIQLDVDIVETLKLIGIKGDTYADIIRRLLDGSKPARREDAAGDRDDS